MSILIHKDGTIVSIIRLRCEELIARGITMQPNLTYEHGVRNAIMWLMAEEDDPNAYKLPVEIPPKAPGEGKPDGGDGARRGGEGRGSSHRR